MTDKRGADVAAVMRDASNGVEEIGRAIATILDAPYGAGAYKTHYAGYERACRGGGIAPLPVTLAKMAHLLGDYVFVRGNKTSGLGTVVSNIKMYVTRFLPGRVLWLPYEDEVRLRSYVSEMEKIAPAEIDYAEPLRKPVLVKMRRYLGPRLASGDPWATQTWAMCLLMHQTCMRASEAVEGGLITSHFQYQCDDAGVVLGMTILKPLHKTSKRAIDAREDCTVVATRGDMFDAVAAVEAHMRVNHPGVTLTAMLGVQFYTPRTAAGRVGGARSVASVVKMLQDDVLRPAGVEKPEQYTGHSFRSGGCTDLLAEGVAYAEVSRIGGWRTDSAQWRYVRLTVDLMRAVRTAAGRGVGSIIAQMDAIDEADGAE